MPSQRNTPPERWHFGDPCIHCGLPHDDVPAGPCNGDQSEATTVSEQQDDKPLSMADELERGLTQWKIKAKTWQKIADQRAIEVADLLVLLREARELLADGNTEEDRLIARIDKAIAGGSHG